MTFGLDPFIRQLVEEHQNRDAVRYQRAFLVRLRRIVGGATIVLGLTFLYVGFRAPNGSFLQSLMANLSTGAGLFLAMPFALKRIQARGFRDEAIAAVLAAVSLTGAYFAGPMLQSVLINAGVDLLVLIALEYAVKFFILDRIETRIRNANAELRTEFPLADMDDEVKLEQHAKYASEHQR